jgi:hypothetical protein
VYGRPANKGMQITIDRDIRKKHHSPKNDSPSTSKKYVNSRIYEQTDAKKIEP